MGYCRVECPVIWATWLSRQFPTLRDQGVLGWTVKSDLGPLREKRAESGYVWTIQGIELQVGCHSLGLIQNPKKELHEPFTGYTRDYYHAHKAHKPLAFFIVM